MHAALALLLELSHSQITIQSIAEAYMVARAFRCRYEVLLLVFPFRNTKEGIKIQEREKRERHVRTRGGRVDLEA